MKRIAVATLAAALFVAHFAGVGAQQPQTDADARSELGMARARGLDHLRARARRKRIVASDDLAVARVDFDARRMVHTRVQQRFRGVRVLGGEAIAHMFANGDLFAETDDLVADINVDTTPSLDAPQAIAIATAEYGCSRCLTGRPEAGLWIVRRNGRDRLVYRVELSRVDGTAATAKPVIFVDAHSGAVVSRYDNLQTGSGNSLYSGTVSIGTYYFAQGSAYVMENPARHLGVYDYQNGVQFTFLFQDFDDIWNMPQHMAAVDAEYGAERYVDYLLNVHGRNGIDGNGGPRPKMSVTGTTLLPSYVHYGSAYNNAFWSGASATYGDGDGSYYGPFPTLDIVGHELTHGLTQYTAGLTYSGESGALNESWSDVFGAMTERYVRGETANTWLNAEQAYTPGIGGDASRYFDTPHSAANKGYTANDDPDHYSERYTGSSDNGGVHINSGIANKAFHLVAKGGGHHVGGSMTGIGADAAARIWYTALTSYMTSTTNFAGARTATLNAAAALYGNGSPQYTAVSSAWCLVGVGSCAGTTADSVSPSTGSAASQTFALRYSDPLGSTYVKQAWVWFNDSLSSSAAGSCLAYYERPTNRLFLLNDAGTSWTSAILGSVITLENSQCAIATASASIQLAGNQLTLNLPVTFKSAFAGLTHTYLFASNLSGMNSGWQSRGDWTVPIVVPTVTADAVTPSSGTSGAQTFAFTYSDSAGATDLKTMWAWFSQSTAYAYISCLSYYDRGTNTLFLLDSAAANWMSAPLGSAATLQNGVCAIAVGSSSVMLSGNTATLSLAITFQSFFTNVNGIYLYATGSAGANSGWQHRGDWSGPITGTLGIGGVTPNAGSGFAQTFSLRYTDTVSAAGLTQVAAEFETTSLGNGENSCRAYYDRPTNSLFLLNDAGTAWQSAVRGDAAILQNSQCAIDVATTAVTLAGNTLTLDLPMTFKLAYAGLRRIYMSAADGHASTGTALQGTWTVPSAIITTGAVTPSGGTGATQTFALSYSDSGGAADLKTAWAWFNDSMSSGAANSCLLYYDRPSGALFLLNDAGTVWIAAPLATATTVSNSQCSVSIPDSSVSVSGNTVVVDLAMTFAPGFAGAKNVYLFASNGTSNSGWQDEGDWTVP